MSRWGLRASDAAQGKHAQDPWWNETDDGNTRTRPMDDTALFMYSSCKDIQYVTFSVRSVRCRIPHEPSSRPCMLYLVVIVSHQVFFRKVPYRDLFRTDKDGM